jgi:hypothetical protein
MMKKFKQRPLVFIGTVLILLLVIVTFVFWGAGDWILPKTGDLGSEQLTFGYYDNIPIEYKPDSLFAEAAEVYQRYGLNREQAADEAFYRAAFRVAVLDAAKKANYTPPKAVVDKLVAKLPKYQDNGNFSYIKYREESELKHVETIKRVREEFIISRYRMDVAGVEESYYDPYSLYSEQQLVKSALKVPSKEADFVASMAKTQRNFEIASFAYSSYPDSEIAFYVENNQSLFKDTNLSQITIPSSEADAKKILASIQSGATNFEEAAKSQSKDMYAPNGGAPGNRTSYELNSFIPNEADRDTVLNLAAGEISVPIKTLFNGGDAWTIFRAETASTPADMSNGITVSKIRNYMMREERGIVEDYLIAKAGDFSKDSRVGGFDAAAAIKVGNVLKYDVSVAKFGPMPINYGDSKIFSQVSSFGVAALNKASESENFWKIAFSTAINEPSVPFVINTANNAVVVINPVSEIANDTTAVENTKSSFTSFLNTNIEQSLKNAILTSKKFKNDFAIKSRIMFENS